MSAHQLAPNTLAGLWVFSIPQMKAEQSSDILKQPCWHTYPYFCEGSKQVIILEFLIPNSVPSLFSDLKVNLIWGEKTYWDCLPKGIWQLQVKRLVKNTTFNFVTTAVGYAGITKIHWLPLLIFSSLISWADFWDTCMSFSKNFNLKNVTWCKM